MKRAASYELGVDIGGTFTDLVLRHSTTGHVHVGKLLTTPDDPAQGALDGIRQLLARSGVAAGAVTRLVHGTTLVTNALIERKGARTAYVTTAGFKDVFETGRQKRYDMYDLAIRFPEPLVPPSLRFELDERIDAQGRVRRPLDPGTVRVLAGQLIAAGVEAVAVCFLHSYRVPDHERLVAQVLAETAPGLLVSLSSEVAPEIREYPRASTTVANAYVTRAAGGYLNRLQAGLRALDCPAVLHVMLSHGGLATATTAARFPIRLLESGPAAGVLAAGILARRLSSVRPAPSAAAVGAAPPVLPSGAAGAPGKGDLAFDMGGTTAKACLLEDGAPRMVSRFEVARVHRLKRGSGLPVSVPCVDLIEIGAGGGSIARIDTLGLLTVGPDSAGARPGPACYGLGGTTPTVTDANLLLGYLDPAFFLGGAMVLDVEAAQRALRCHIAAPLGVDLLPAAWAIHTAVNEHMASAVRVHAAERGADPRALDLIAFGGAGPIHAERLARSLHMRRVVVPLGAGAASSLGLLAAPLSFDFALSLPAVLDALDPAAIAAAYAQMQSPAAAVLQEAGVTPEKAAYRYSCDMRYAGQIYEVSVPFGDKQPWQLSPADLRAQFEAVYRRLYGRDYPEATVETVTWRLLAMGPRPAFRLQHEDRASGQEYNRDRYDRAAACRGTRLAYAPELGGMVPFSVYNRNGLCPGEELAGPAIVEERESTAIVGPGATATVHADRTLLITLPARHSA
jgi:N-methylhydantoinase A